MKILCPIDFSHCSSNALNYALSFAQIFPEKEIHLINCIDFIQNNNQLRVATDILQETSLTKMKELLVDLRLKHPDTTIEGEVFIASPKTYIKEYSEKHGINTIIMGSTGLTRLKNISVGSVAESVARNSNIPVLLVPGETSFITLKTVVIGYDGNNFSKSNALDEFILILNKYFPKLVIAQIENKNEARWDENLKNAFENFNPSYKSITAEGKISEILNDVADNLDAQWLCIFHKHRGWFSDLFHHSILREELFQLELPILVLPN